MESLESNLIAEIRDYLEKTFNNGIVKYEPHLKPIKDYEITDEDIIDLGLLIANMLIKSEVEPYKSFIKKGFTEAIDSKGGLYKFIFTELSYAQAYKQQIKENPDCIAEEVLQVANRIMLSRYGLLTPAGDDWIKLSRNKSILCENNAGSNHTTETRIQ